MELIRFQVVIILQMILLIFDIFVNAFADMLGYANVNLLILYVLQCLCIFFAIVVALLQLFNTYIFKAGLAGFLLAKFTGTIIVTIVYLSLCIAIHVWSLRTRWDNPTLVMDGGFTALYTIQRTWSVLYYYFYKRTALRLGDRRFYCDSELIRREFEKRQ